MLGRLVTFVQVETAPDPVLGVEGYVATAPRAGALVILVGLLASRTTSCQGRGFGGGAKTPKTSSDARTRTKSSWR